MHLKPSFVTLSALAALFKLTTSAFADDSLVVTYAESPKQETSSLTGTSVFDFNSLPLGVDKNVTWSGVGSFDQLNIKTPDQYGGATDATHPNGTDYSVQGVGSSVKETTLTLTQNSGYFGMWWSAGDAANVLDFYNGNTLVAQFTTASLLSSLPKAYDGNPRNPLSLDSNEPFAFINFYGSSGTTWNRIVLTNNSSSGFESDNYTVRTSTYNPVVDGPVLPGVPVARVTGTTTTKVSKTATGAALWGSTSAIPGAPAPPLFLAAAFGVCCVAKGRSRSQRKTA